MFSIFRSITKWLSGKGLGKIPGFRFLHKFLFSLLRPQKEVLIEVQGNKMFVNPKDKGVGSYLLLYGVHGDYETELARQLIKPSMKVLDIGAQIGYFTLIFSKCVGANGKVYAFEPEPGNYDLLERNIKINNLSNVILCNKALSDKSGRKKLYLDKSNLGNMSFSGENVSDFGGEVEVEAVSLDDFLRGDEKIDFIKIDVQGAEELVLKGAQRTLEGSGLKILMEFWPYGLRSLGTEPQLLLKWLQSKGFKISIADSSQRIVRSASVEEIMKLANNREAGRGFGNLLCEKS